MGVYWYGHYQILRCLLQIGTNKGEYGFRIKCSDTGFIACSFYGSLLYNLETKCACRLCTFCTIYVAYSSNTACVFLYFIEGYWRRSIWCWILKVFSKNSWTSDKLKPSFDNDTCLLSLADGWEIEKGWSSGCLRWSGDDVQYLQ